MRKGKGFTLIETVVSIAILGFGLLACARMMSQGLEIKNRSENVILAGLLAQEKMEEGLAGMHRSDGEGEVKAGRSNFRWQRRFRKIASEPELSEIEISVFWMERGTKRSLRILSYTREANTR